MLYDIVSCLLLQCMFMMTNIFTTTQKQSKKQTKNDKTNWKGSEETICLKYITDDKQGKDRISEVTCLKLFHVLFDLYVTSFYVIF